MFFKSYTANQQGRDFVIGDLHGMYDQLFAHLQAVNFDFDKDRCFSCGDLIDRGPDSEKCLSLIHEPWFFPVRGNHEDTLIQTVRNSNSATLADWVLNGGRWHLMVSSAKMSQYARELESLPLLMEIELGDGRRVAVCHAEYPLSYWNPEEVRTNPALRHALQWSRVKCRGQDESIVTGVEYIICGHTIIDAPLTLGNTLFIDTGCFKTNHLTVLPLDELP